MLLRHVARTMFASAIALMCIGSGAQANPLADELTSLIESHPQIREARANFKAAQSLSDDAFSKFLPQLTATGDKGFESIDSPGRRASANGNTSRLPRETGSLEASINVFDGFLKEANLDSADAASRVARQTLESVTQTTLSTALTVYINVLLQKDKYKKYNDLVNVIQSQIQLQRQAVGETVNQIDLLSLVAAEQRNRTAQVGFDGTFNNFLYQYSQTFGDAPDLADMTSIDIPISLMPASDEELVDIVLKNNPQIMVAQEQVDQATHQVRAAQSTYYPTFTLKGTSNYEDDVDAVRGVRRDYSILLEGRWSLFDGFGTQARTSAARQQEVAARNRNRFAHRQVVQQAQSAWNNFQTAQQQIELAEESAITAREIAEIQLQRLNNGVGTSLEYLAAEEASLLADIALVDTQTTMMVSAYQVLFAMGRLTPGIFGLETASIEDTN